MTGCFVITLLTYIPRGHSPYVVIYRPDNQFLRCPDNKTVNIDCITLVTVIVITILCADFLDGNRKVFELVKQPYRRDSSKNERDCHYGRCYETYQCQSFFDRFSGLHLNFRQSSPR